MRIVRRKVLNVAGTVFIAAAVLRIVFLITGLRTYAERPEIPLRVVEITAMGLLALYTYFFSRKFGFALMLAPCALMAIPLFGEMTSGGMTGGTNRLAVQTDGARIFFSILLLTGFVLLIALSILANPMIKRNRTNALVIRILSVLLILIFVALVIHRIVCLVMTLAAETYPHQYRTKDYYADLAAFLGLIVTGVAYFITASVDPTHKVRMPEEAVADNVIEA